MKPPPVEYGLCQYAVLRHSGVDEPHFDLLFETTPTSSLITFRLQEWPPSKDQAVKKLKDHRRLYLTYEGVVPGGDRGRVDRVADGQLHVTGGPNGWHLHRPESGPLLTIEPDDADPTGETWWAAL